MDSMRLSRRAGFHANRYIVRCACLESRVFTRREILAMAAAVGAAGLQPAGTMQEAPLITKKIPKSGEALPVIGLGTRNYRSNPGGDLDPYRRTLAAFIEAGGRVIDSAPSYGNSESVLGALLSEDNRRDRVFLATKVDRQGREAGIERMDASLRALRTPRIDLMQVHNLTDTANQLTTLREWKAAGLVRYVGVTTSSPAQYAELERLLREETIDFVQLDYALDHREAADRLLPLAADRGVAVLVNLPFGRGRLFQAVGNRPLPDWAAGLGCATWAQFFLKYVVSHPAVTCAIPGMTKPEHAIDNLGACRGRLPNADDRRRMEDLLAGL